METKEVYKDMTILPGHARVVWLVPEAVANELRPKSWDAWAGRAWAFQGPETELAEGTKRWPQEPARRLLLILVSNSLIVTTSKALVTRSDALVSSSLFGCKN